MSDALATRCSACGTVFRVVPDQLRVSDGWVRCGRCAEVFNAARALLDAHTGEPRVWPEVQADVQADVQAGVDAEATPPHPAAADAPTSPPAPPPWTPEVDLAPASPFETTQVLSPSAEPGPPTEAESDGSPFDRAPGDAGGAAETTAATAGVETSSSPMPLAVDVPFDVDALIDASADPQPASVVDPLRAVDDTAATEPPLFDTAQPAFAAEAPQPERSEPPFAPAETFSATPSFVRRAERAERWRRPRVRAALLAVLLLGLLALAAQMAIAWRDGIAARLPFTRPALEQGCAWLGCRIGAPRSAADLTVESSGLLRVGDTDAYRLQLAVRNQSAIDLAMPAVELSLTDTQGKLLARRVLRASELGVEQPLVAAGRDLQLQATLRITTEPVAGYTVLLFYP